jgi:hypothetical protein
MLVLPTPNPVAHPDAFPSSLLDPLEGLSMLSCGKLELGGRSRLPALNGVRGRARSPRIRLGRGTIMLLHEPASKTNPKLVRTHSASIWCWNKPRATLDSLDSPRPGLGGSHHLPPYSILCVTPREPHPNDTFSRDSQGRVLKLSQIGFLGLWALISPGFDLRLE